MADYNSSYTGAQIDAAVGAVASKADDTAVVHDTGNETIGGVKTFSSFPVTPSSAPTADYQMANKKYVDDNNYTHPSTHSADMIVDGTTNKAYTATEQTKLAGIEEGATADMTGAEIRTALGITTLSGSNTGDQTLPVKATGAEADTGTDDDKFLTPKAAKDSHNIPSVAPGTSGNVLTSNGTDWISAAAAGGGAQFAYGSYTGTGTSGTSNRNSLTFGLSAKIAIISSAGSYNKMMILVNPCTYACAILDDSPPYAGHIYGCAVTWNSTGVSWYTTGAGGTAMHQLNQSGVTYYYTVFY